MFILNQARNTAYNLDNVSRIEVVDDTNEYRKLHPAINDRIYSIKLWFGEKDAVVIATYTDKVTAECIYRKVIECVANPDITVVEVPAPVDMDSEYEEKR